MRNLTNRSFWSDEEEEKSDEDLSEESSNSESDESDCFRCEICLTEFEIPNMQEEHLDEDDLQFFCKTCGVNLKLTLDFIDYEWEHNSDDLYECPLCQFKVEERTEITLHLQERHDQFKKYVCKICKKSIEDYSQFLDHKYTHKEEKPFQCDQWDSLFADNDTLRRHSTKMHRDISISCDVCQRTFTSREELRSHKTSHHRELATCRVRGKTLSNKSNVRLHKNTNLYTCQFCSKSFTAKQYCSEHEKIHTGHRPHICSVCNKGFMRPSLLKIHEATHNANKPFQCNICVKQFLTKKGYDGHMKKCSANSAVNSQEISHDRTNRNHMPENNRKPTKRKPQK